MMAAGREAETASSRAGGAPAGVIAAMMAAGREAETASSRAGETPATLAAKMAASRLIGLDAAAGGPGAKAVDLFRHDDR